jgi:predicted xylose isomerase-like sugar epimerase
MSKDEIIISEKGLKVLDVICKNMEANHKMIDGWEHGWKKEEVERAESLIEALNGIGEALDSMGQVGMVFPLVEAELSKSYSVAKKILDNAKMKLKVHDEVYNKNKEE